jgi:hypothetical protein
MKYQTGLDEAELGLLLHTLGLTDPFIDEGYRNNFVAGTGHADMPTITRLVERGLMVEVEMPHYLARGDRLFMATDIGKASAQASRPRPTRARRRYRRYLEARDAYPDLTFLEWLKMPDLTFGKTRTRQRSA